MKAAHLVCVFGLLSVPTGMPTLVAAGEASNVRVQADKLANQAFDELEAKEFQKGISDARAALTLYGRVHDSESDRARCLMAIGTGEWDSGNMEGARAAFERTISILRPKYGAQEAYEATAEFWLGASLLNLERLDAAVEPLKESLDVRRQIDPSNAPSSAAVLGRVYYLMERVDEAIPLLTEGSTALAGRAKTADSSNVEELAAATVDLSDIMLAKGQESRSKELARLAWTYYSKQTKPTSLGLHNAVVVAMAAQQDGDLTEARSLLERAYLNRSRMPPGDQVRATFSLFVIAAKQGHSYREDLERQCATPATPIAKNVCNRIGWHEPQETTTPPVDSRK